MNKTKQLVFFKNLYKAVKSGLPPGSFFNKLGEKAILLNGKNIYKEISKEIENGSNITQALSKYPALFDKLYLSLINAGEKSGKLDEIVDNIINIIENDLSLQKKLSSNLRQPLINIGGAILIFGVLFFAFIPALFGFFGNFEFFPPFITKIFFFLQHNLQGLRGVFLTLFIVITLIMMDFYNAEADDIPDYIDHKLIKLPVIGDLNRWASLYIFFMVIKTAYTAGLSQLEAIELANTTIQNKYLKTYIDALQEKSKKGKPLGALLKEFQQDGIIEQDIIELVEIGETTGRSEEAYNDVIKLLKHYIDSKIDFICNFTPAIGFIMAAAPVVIIIIIILGILTKTSGIIMDSLKQIGI